MATLTMSKPKKSAVKGRVKLPVKRSINLANAGEKPINMKIGIPVIILILIATVVFAKFGVVDQFNALSDAEDEVNAVKHELSENYEKLDRYEELEAKYAHYTFSGMTQDELSQVDRAATVKMIERVILPNAQLKSWSITNNTLLLSLSAQTLQDINLLATKLEDEELVDYCHVTSAATDQNYIVREDGSLILRSDYLGNGVINFGVTAQVTAYLIEGAEK